MQKPSDEPTTAGLRRAPAPRRSSATDERALGGTGQGATALRLKLTSRDRRRLDGVFRTSQIHLVQNRDETWSGLPPRLPVSRGDTRGVAQEVQGCKSLQLPRRSFKEERQASPRAHTRLFRARKRFRDTVVRAAVADVASPRSSNQSEQSLWCSYSSAHLPSGRRTSCGSTNSLIVRGMDSERGRAGIRSGLRG